MMNTFAVIFDMDGVLVDSRAAHLRSWQLLGEETGRLVSEAEFDKGFGRTSREVIRESFGVIDEATVHRLDLRKEAIYRDIIRGQIPAMPGADELITRLYGMNIPLAVGSSGPPENVMLVCDAMGWTSKFSAIVTGADVSRGKPDPQVFLIAAQRLGMLPGKCTVIEDAPAGIEAAHRAGMQVVALIGSYTREALAKADSLIDRLSEFDSSLGAL
jgi:beta-phosphoglucomutase